MSKSTRIELEAIVAVLDVALPHAIEVLGRLAKSNNPGIRHEAVDALVRVALDGLAKDE